MKPQISSNDPVILTVATTGGVHGKEINSALPEQPDEIIEAMAECYQAGATVAHLHVRGKDGQSTVDLGVYAEVLAGIRERCPGMITQIGNGMGTRQRSDGTWESATLDQRMALLTLDPAPDMLTVNAGTFHFGSSEWEELFENSLSWNREFILGSRERGVVNELEVYDISHIYNMLRLRDEGVLQDPLHFSIVLGIAGGAPADPRYLLMMLDAIPDGSSWQVVATGRAQLPLTTLAMLVGGNMRTGLEDNVYYRRGELAESNRQLVERTVRIVEEVNREVAEPKAAHRLLLGKTLDLN